MESILEKLYQGEISPGEQYRPRIQEHRAMRREHLKNYEDYIELLKSYEPTLHERFIQIMDEQFNTLPFEMSEVFIDGFRLGAKIAIEVCYEDFPKE